jgi:hypothetical protein
VNWRRLTTWFAPRWNAIDVPNAFTIHLPKSALHYFDDDTTAFCVRLGTGKGVTEIRISQHPMPPRRAGQSPLEGVVREFLEGIVSRVTGKEHRAVVEQCSTQQTAVQGFTTDGDGTWWLVRAYDAGDEFFWLQWCGPERVMVRPVLEIFESFTPAQQGVGNAAQQRVADERRGEDDAVRS